MPDSLSDEGSAIPMIDGERSRVIQGRFAAGRPVLRGLGNGSLTSGAHGLSVRVSPDLLGNGPPGRPLPASLQQGMESFFDTSFRDVRIHVGPQASQIGADAFTSGSDLYFTPGRFDAHTSHGRRLLAHELTHVVQQRAGRVRNPFGEGVAIVQDLGLEAEAQRMAIQASSTRPSHALQATRSRSTITRGSQDRGLKKRKQMSYRYINDDQTYVVGGPISKRRRQGRQTTHRVGGRLLTSSYVSRELNAFLKKVGIYSRISRFEGGHLIADRYGGRTYLKNLVPMPHVFNTITYKKWENKIGGWIGNQEVTMEVSVQYPDDSLEGFLSRTEQNRLRREVGDLQMVKLEDLFALVPSWIAWEVNKPSRGLKWIEFDNIRKDILPRGFKKRLKDNWDLLVEAVEDL